jgi:hypothetical protein
MLRAHHDGGDGDKNLGLDVNGDSGGQPVSSAKSNRNVSFV